MPTQMRFNSGTRQWEFFLPAAQTWEPLADFNPRLADQLESVDPSLITGDAIRELIRQQNAAEGRTGPTTAPIVSQPFAPPDATRAAPSGFEQTPGRHERIEGDSGEFFGGALPEHFGGGDGGGGPDPGVPDLGEVPPPPPSWIGPWPPTLAAKFNPLTGKFEEGGPDFDAIRRAYVDAQNFRAPEDVLGGPAGGQRPQSVDEAIDAAILAGDFDRALELDERRDELEKPRQTAFDVATLAAGQTNNPLEFSKLFQSLGGGKLGFGDFARDETAVRAANVERLKRGFTRPGSDEVFSRSTTERERGIGGFAERLGFGFEQGFSALERKAFAETPEFAQDLFRQAEHKRTPARFGGSTRRAQSFATLRR